MKINEKLNLVVPLLDDEGAIYAYVHSTPIGYEAFEANFWLVSKTYTAILEGGLGATAGPKVAAMVLRDVAKRIAGPGETGDDTVRPLMAEIKRLTTVICAKDTGWEPVPYDTAVSRNMLQPEDAREVESAIVFFTVGWLMFPRQRRTDLVDGAAQIWGALTSSRTASEFITSLKPSTATPSTGVRAVA